MYRQKQRNNIEKIKEIKDLYHTSLYRMRPLDNTRIN